MICRVKDACLSFKSQFYTLTQIVEASGIDRKIMRHKMWKLAKNGYVTVIKSYDMPPADRGRPYKEYWFRNTKKLIPVLPLIARTDKQNGWDIMWKAVRALRRFTRDDLSRICGQTIENVTFFTKYYRKLGYMRPSKERGRAIVWTLTKDPGPARPIGGKISAKAQEDLVCGLKY